MPKVLLVSSIIYEGIGEVSIHFFLWRNFTRKKSTKYEQATFTQIFYAHKKHKKHKKQLLPTYFKRLKNIKSNFYS